MSLLQSISNTLSVFGPHISAYMLICVSLHQFHFAISKLIKFNNLRKAQNILLLLTSQPVILKERNKVWDYSPVVLRYLACFLWQRTKGLGIEAKPGGEFFYCLVPKAFRVLRVTNLLPANSFIWLFNKKQKQKKNTAFVWHI